MNQKKMTYPKRGKRLLQVKECTVAICNNNNPASILLSTFLFWYDYPRNGDTCQDNIFTICRTQADIEQAACNQIDVKTIHDTAVPFLQLFGYLTVKEKMNGNLYSINIDRVNTAFAAYEKGDKELRDFLKSSLQLESAPIKMSNAELESALINKRGLYLQLERVLIVTRADSNCKRGRKPRAEANSGANPERQENIETIRESNKRESKTANAVGQPFIPTEPPSQNGHKKSSSSESKTEGAKQPTPITSKQGTIILTEEEQRIFDLYCQMDFIKVPPKMTADRKRYCSMLAPYVQTKEEMKSLADFARSQLKKRGIKTYAVELGNLANSNILNNWEKPKEPDASQPPLIPEDESEQVVWTKKPGIAPSQAKKHWYLYELMPKGEAKQYGWSEFNHLVPNDENDIANKLECLADGRITLPKDAILVA